MSKNVRQKLLFFFVLIFLNTPEILTDTSIRLLMPGKNIFLYYFVCIFLKSFFSLHFFTFKAVSLPTFFPLLLCVLIYIQNNSKGCRSMPLTSLLCRYFIIVSLKFLNFNFFLRKNFEEEKLKEIRKLPRL